MGKNFWSIISQWRKKIWTSNSQVWIQGITINAHKQILDDFQNNAIVLFYQLCYIHTCELEFDIFLLRWDMIDQNFFSQWLPIQILRKSPYYSVHFIFLTSLRIRLIGCATPSLFQYYHNLLIYSNSPLLEIGNSWTTF